MKDLGQIARRANRITKKIVNLWWASGDFYSIINLTHPSVVAERHMKNLPRLHGFYAWTDYWTDYWTGLHTDLEKVYVISYDYNKYVEVIRSNGFMEEVKAGYLYSSPDTKKNFNYTTLCRLYKTVH